MQRRVRAYCDRQPASTAHACIADRSPRSDETPAHRVCAAASPEQDQAERRARPLARRALITARPPAVAMRARKPCFFARRRSLGWNVRFTETSEIGLPDENNPSPCKAQNRKTIAATPKSLVQRSVTGYAGRRRRSAAVRRGATVPTAVAGRPCDRHVPRGAADRPRSIDRQ